MKVLLNCDEVFETLTSGYDAVREDEALQEHLEYCAECRRWAEATGPASDLFAEVLRANELDRCGAESVANCVLARLETEQDQALVESHSRSFLSLSGHAWSQLGAAAAILLALGGLFWAASPSEQALRQELAALPAFTSPLGQPTHPTEHGLLHLASLQLPEACLSSTVAFQEAAMFHCCTRCHHGGDMLPAVRLVAFTQQSCVACHKS